MTIAEATVIATQSWSDLTLTVASAAIDLGVCAVLKYTLTDSPLFLYCETYDRTCGVAASLVDWIDSDWSDPASDFIIPKGF